MQVEVRSKPGEPEFSTPPTAKDVGDVVWEFLQENDPTITGITFVRNGTGAIRAKYKGETVAIIATHKYGE